MNYTKLRELRDELDAKSSKTTDEIQLLNELKSLNQILDSNISIGKFSLATASTNCPTCGKSFK